MNIIQYLRQTTQEPGLLKYALSDEEALTFLKETIKNGIQDHEIPIANTVSQSPEFEVTCEEVADYICNEVKKG